MSLAAFLQDKSLRVEIVSQDDVACLYVNKPVLYMHGICLEPWIGPEGNPGQSVTQELQIVDWLALL